VNQPILAALLPATALVAVLAPLAPALAGPVVCTTTLEAPTAYGAPVAISRCGPTMTVPELATRRFYSYTAPFERGVDLTHQITDLFGIAMGGGDGTKVMGFGFPDQTIISDGLALQNTTATLLESQSNPMPFRSADLSSCLSGSLAGSSCGSARRYDRLSGVAETSVIDPTGTAWNTSVRGLR
jgi:hypothetical protein